MSYEPKYQAQLRALDDLISHIPPNILPKLDPKIQTLKASILAKRQSTEWAQKRGAKASSTCRLKRETEEFLVEIQGGYSGVITGWTALVKHLGLTEGSIRNRFSQGGNTFDYVYGDELRSVTRKGCTGNVHQEYAPLVGPVPPKGGSSSAKLAGSTL